MPFYFRLGKRSQQYNVASKDLFVIPIELMANECIECTLFSTSIGQECLNNVCQKIGLQQPDYFGLIFKSKKNVDQWVDLNKPLKKQLDKYSTDIRLYFRLQYFVPNFHFLSDEVSRYYYFCAMKGLVIDGRIACSREDAILLASFSLQAEFSDYSPERHTVEYLNNFALFPKSMVTNKMARDVLVECAINAYRNLQGVPTNVAEIYYISEAQQREGYGQEGFPARDLDTGQDVCLGVCIRGIFVINTSANTVELFKWMDIANLIHHKKVFTIERNAENFRKNYSTYDSDYASCIWRTCVEQHQYFKKGIQAFNETELTNNEHQNTGSSIIIPNGTLIQNNDSLYIGGDNFMQAKPMLNSTINNIDYSQIQSISSLYETINKSTLSNNKNRNMAISNIELSKNMHPQEYNLNGCVEQQIDIKKRSLTEPIDLQQIIVNCANNSNVNLMANNECNNVPHLQPPTTNSPHENCSSNTPIYENQLNPGDLTYAQRKKLLPPYKNPPDYDTFLKQKYSAMANMSQSLSCIPSRLASHNQINCSSSSLAHSQNNNTVFNNGNQHISSSSTISVPHLLQQQQQPRESIFSANVYKNYADLSSLDIDKSSALPTATNYRNSMLPNDSSLNTQLDPILLNQLRFQKQQSGILTCSSPELNTLNLLQKRNVQFKNQSRANPIKQMESNNETNLKSRMHFPHCFASVPDLTFHNSAHQSYHMNSEINNDYKKNGNKMKNLCGRNLKIFRSQNTGSEPNLFNNFSNCYNLQKLKLLSDHRSHSNSANEQQQSNRHVFSYSISNKIDEAPELSPNERANEFISSPSTSNNLSSQSNVYSPSHKPNQVQQQQQQQVIYVNLNPAPSNKPNLHVQQANNEPPTVPDVDANSVKSILQRVNVSTYNNIVDISNKPAITLSNPINQVPNAQFDQQPTIVSSLNFPTNDNNKTVINSIFNEPPANKDSAYSPKPLNIAQNSRIIVFDKCFQDQDFTREFELLPRMNPKAKFSTASLNENILKNRFRDILPYEENRVKLSQTKENKTGYINASHVFMTFGSMTQHYIAAQGPLPNTTLDFWQMIFEQNISLIVMVTNFTESGNQKCYTYLPLSNELGKQSMRFGDYEITCNYTSILSTYVTSVLTLSHNGQKRNVTHLRYTDWNDHSIPGDLQGFLSFLSEMDAIYRRNTREGSGFGKKRSSNKLQQQPPILIHCSAGAGRSGVVILCDALLKCLDHNFSQPIDIPRALIQLRYQRMISVQHCEQFRFVCQVLSQYLANSRLI